MFRAFTAFFLAACAAWLTPYDSLEAMSVVYFKSRFANLTASTVSTIIDNLKADFAEVVGNNPHGCDELAIIWMLGLTSVGVILFADIYSERELLRRCHVPQDVWIDIVVHSVDLLFKVATFIFAMGFITAKDLTTKDIWLNFSPTAHVPWPYRLMFYAQGSYYVQALLYANLLRVRASSGNVIGNIRKLSIIFVLVLGYCLRMHQLGMMLLYLHAPCDILLDTLNLVGLLPYPDDITTKSMARVQLFVFSIFMFLWGFTRLFLVPLDALLSLMKFANEDNGSHSIPFLWLFVTSQLIIFGLNVAWALIITVRFVVTSLVSLLTNIKLDQCRWPIFRLTQLYPEL